MNLRDVNRQVKTSSLFLLFVLPLLWGCESSPELKIKFASVSEGQTILLASDPFLAEIKQSDITQRLCKEQYPTIQSFRDTLRSCVLEWTEEEKRQLVDLFDSIDNADTALAKLLEDEEITLVKTSGTESLEAFYTLKTAIILPATSFRLVDKIELLRHELFHILSRKNPSIRRQLYALLNYHILERPIQLADSIRQYLLHNPDSPILDYYRKTIDKSGREVFTTVVLLQYGRCLFDSIVTSELTLLPVNGSYEVQSVRSAPEILDIPEEELADAFEELRGSSDLGVAVDSLVRAIARVD